MGKKAKVEIIETSNNNVKVGDKFGVNILAKNGGVAKGKRTGRGTKKPKKPTLMSAVLDLAKDVKQINTRLGVVENKIDGLEEVVTQQGKELKSLGEDVKEIFNVLDRNELK
jgi:flagellin-like hook-associated protein FlgL